MSASIQENRKRKVTIFYDDCPYMGENGLETIDGWVELNLRELDGSRTILIRTDPTHSHPNIHPIHVEQATNG